MFLFQRLFFAQESQPVFGSAPAPLPPPQKKMAPAPHPWKKGMIYKKKKHIENNRNIFKVVFEVMAGQSNFHLTAKKNNQECIEIRALVIF